MEKACRICKTVFVITLRDLEFYEVICVCVPTFCPRCRLQRRLASRNERGLYKRACDLCKKQVIAMYPQDVVFPVYCRECWNSDQWNPLEYGKQYDFARPFFAQFAELQRVVPRIALQVDNCVNCEFANQIGRCKNCYLIYSGSDNEDCAYSHLVQKSRHCFDCLLIDKCEMCYGAIECFDSAYLTHATDCTDSVNLCVLL